MINFEKITEAEQRKLYFQIVIEHEDGELLVMKRKKAFDNLKERPEIYQIAVYGEVRAYEKDSEAVKRIVFEQTGMRPTCYKQVYQDICMCAPFSKRSFVCVVKDNKEAVELNIPEIENWKWLPKQEWKQFLESGEVLRNERSSYHNYFHEKGVLPKYYVDVNNPLKYNLEEMKSEARENVDLTGRHAMSLFAWYDKEIDGVQLYIWHMELPEGYLHYIINETTTWTRDEEVCFDYYMREASNWDGVDGEAIFGVYKNKYPALELAYEYDENTKNLLAELHYFFLGGAKKILYENGLRELAQSLTELEIEYKEDGSTPSEILFDIPLPALYAISSYRGALLLTEVKMRSALKAFYEEAPEFFSERLTDSRMFDLESILESQYISCDTQEMYEENSIFNARSKEIYQTYLKHREQLQDITKNLPLQPPLKSRFRFYNKANRMIRYLQHEKEIDEELYKIHEDLTTKYAYQDEHYEIVVPKNLREYLGTAEAMFHDYWQFIEFIVQKQTGILLMLDKEKQCIPIAAIEISDNRIIDVRGKYNMNVSEEVQGWVGKYAEEKHLIYENKENEDDLPLPFD